LVSEVGLRHVEGKPTTFVTNLLGFTPYSVLNLAHLFRGSEPKQGGEKDESYIVVDMTLRWRLLRRFIRMWISLL